MKKFYGKPIDLRQLKRPVLKNLRHHLNQVKKMTAYLAKHERAVPQKSCYICGTRRAKPFAKIYQTQYVQCAKCGHFYTTTRYTEEAIKRFYQKSHYYATVTYANKETCFYRRDHVAKPKVKFAEQFTRRKGEWIDVGAGIGDLVSVLQQRGWKATGIEISEDSVAFGKEIFDVDLVPQTLEEYASAHPEKAGKVTGVSFIGLLEHTVNPLQHLELAHRLLRPKGLVMIQVPHGPALTSMIQAVFPQQVFRHMSPVEHVMLFSEPSLVAAVKQTGFKPLAMWYHGLDIYELVNNLILVNKKVQGSPFYEAIMQNFNELQQVIDNHELSDRLICIAQKK